MIRTQAHVLHPQPQIPNEPTLLCQPPAFRIRISQLSIIRWATLLALSVVSLPLRSYSQLHLPKIMLRKIMEIIKKWSSNIISSINPNCTNNLMSDKLYSLHPLSQVSPVLEEFGSLGPQVRPILEKMVRIQGDPLRPTFNQPTSIHSQTPISIQKAHRHHLMDLLKLHPQLLTAVMKMIK